MATNELSILLYKKNKYKLKTCCLNCANEMNKISKNNPDLFKKLYINDIDEKGNIIAMNRHTKTPVQLLTIL